MNQTSRLPSFLLSLALLAAFSAAAAQETRTTGTVSATIAGEELALHSTAQHVPENVADGVEDPEQRAILEKVAGTDQHTATFMVTDAVKVGPTVVVPARLYVTIDANLRGADRGEHGGISIRFSLDPESLDAASMDDVEVLYYPNGWDLGDYYALTEGAIALESVVLVDERTIAIAGSIDGVLTHQTGYEAVHNSADALPVMAAFSIDEVVGSDVALELLSGE